MTKYRTGTAVYAVIASMVGAGILTSSGYTLHETGNAWTLLTLWLVGGLLAIAGALTITELAVAAGRSGGDYIFVRNAFGNQAGAVAGMSTFVLGFAGPTALIAHLACRYLVPIGNEFAVKIAATTLILLTTWMHTKGVRMSERWQASSTLIKIIFFLTILFFGFLSPRGSWDHFAEGGWPQADEWNTLFISLIYVGYAYSGWNAAAYLAGEVDRPSTTLARAMIGGTMIVTLFYVCMNALFIYAAAPSEYMLMQTREFEQVGETSMLRLFGPSWGPLVNVGIGLSLISSVSGYVLTGSRVAYAMALDGMFPAFASRVHQGVPSAATWSLGILSTFFLWWGSFLELLQFTSAGLALISGLVVASSFALNRKNLSYRMPFYPLPPIFYLCLIGLTVFFSLQDQASFTPTAASVGVFVGCILVTFFRSRTNVKG